MEQVGFTSEMNYALQTLTSPVGAVAVFVFLILLIFVLMNAQAKWWVIALTIWLSSVAFFIKDHRVTPLAVPLQSIVNQGRSLTSAMLILLLPTALLASRGWRRRLIGL